MAIVAGKSLLLFRNFANENFTINPIYGGQCGSTGLKNAGEFGHSEKDGDL